MRDLRERRLEPLAVRVRADAKLEHAVGRQARRALLVPRHHRNAPAVIDAGAVRGLLAEDREPHADAAAVRLAPPLPLAPLRNVERAHRAAQRLGVVAAVEILLGDVHEGHRVRRHQVREAHFVRLLPRLARDRVEDQLEREAHAGARDAAVRQDRRLVGRRRPGAAAIAVHAIRPGQDRADLRRLEARRERIGRVGARVDDRLAVDREQPSVGVGVTGDVVVVLAAVGVGRQLLEPVLEPAHRPPELHREPAEAHLLRQQDALVAEPAADVRRDDADAPLVDAETLREPGAVDVRHLRRRMDGELVEPPVVVRHHAAPLDRRHALARGADAPPHADRGARADACEIVVDHGLEHDVVAPVLVHERRPRLDRRDHVDDGGQLLELDLDQRRDVLGFRASRRDAHRDQLADLAHLALREHVLRRRLEALERRVGDDRSDAGEIVDGEDRLLVTGGLAHRADARVRHRRAHERDVEHPDHADVADVLAAAAEEARVLLAAEAGAHALARRAVGRPRALAPRHAAARLGCGRPNRHSPNDTSTSRSGTPRAAARTVRTLTKSYAARPLPVHSGRLRTSQPAYRMRNLVRPRSLLASTRRARCARNAARSRGGSAATVRRCTCSTAGRMRAVRRRPSGVSEQIWCGCPSRPPHGAGRRVARAGG